MKKITSPLQLLIILSVTAGVILLLESRPSPQAFQWKEITLSNQLSLVEKQLDSLAILLEQERLVSFSGGTLKKLKSRPDSMRHLLSKSGEGCQVKEDIIKFANLSVLVADEEYDRYLKQQLPVANFSSTKEYEEYKGRIEAMQQMAAADRQLRQGNITASLDQFFRLIDDLRLTKDQQTLATKLTQR